METFLIRALQLIMSLSLLVIIHEGGHFLFARLFKVRVEKFCLFFDPWFTLFKFKPKKSDTEYAVGWLPLGGYVKIAGMIDESMDTEQMKQPEQPWEFRSKTGVATSANHGGWRTVQLPVGPVHLLDDSICVGRPIYKGAGSSSRYGFQRNSQIRRFSGRRHPSFCRRRSF